MFNSHSSPFSLDDDNELLSSEFFDSIQSVERCSDGSSESDDINYINNNNESDFVDNYLDNLPNELNFSSTASSPINLDILSETNSPIMDINLLSGNESEIITPTVDQSLSINENNYDESFLKFSQPVKTQSKPVGGTKMKCAELFIKKPIQITKVIQEPVMIRTINNKTFTATQPLLLTNNIERVKFIRKTPIKNTSKIPQFTTTTSNAKRPIETCKEIIPINKRMKASNELKNQNGFQFVTQPANHLKANIVKLKVDPQIPLKTLNEDGFKGENVCYVIPRLNNNKTYIKAQSPVQVNGDCKKPVELSPEEIKGLSKLGVQLPAFHPLTKSQEGALKRVRRKIRNKISAQDSRKRKKEYVDQLEEKVKMRNEENRNLKKKINELQSTYNNLTVNMNRLQNIISNVVGSKLSPTTCLTLFMVSVFIITIRDMHFPKYETIRDFKQVGAISRSLLSLRNKMEEDNANIENVFIDSYEFYEKFANENDTADGNLMKFMENLEKAGNEIFDLQNESDNINKTPPDRNLLSLLFKSIITLMTDNGLFNNNPDGNEGCKMNEESFTELDNCEHTDEITLKMGRLINTFISSNGLISALLPTSATTASTTTTTTASTTTTTTASTATSTTTITSSQNENN